MGIEWFMLGRYRTRKRPIFRTDPVRGTQRNHEGKCDPVSIGFAEAEDNELCISLDAFTNDDVAPSPIARSTSGARKICVRNLGDFLPLVMAGLLTTALSAEGGSRVIVSTTLDSTLEIFDADSLAELQSPLPSKGGGPVRLWVQNFDGKDYLFAANHGAVLGSVGVFDLSGEQVMELPLSPFAARAGSVGIAAGELSVGATQVPTVFVTNTQSAAAAVAGLGCSLPNGSVTAYDASVLSTVGLLQEIGTVDVSAPIPYAVSVDPAGARAFASTNCGDTLDTLTVAGSGADGSSLVLTRTATRSTGAGPDGTIYDGAPGLHYPAHIG